MAFFSTPEVEWLYSGVTMTNPSNEAILSAHCLGVLVLVLAHRGRQRLVQVRQRVVAQVDELELGVAAARGDVVDPRGDLLAVAVGTGAAEDDADPGHESSSCAVSGRAPAQTDFTPVSIPAVE